MLARLALHSRIQTALSRSRVAAILGPRQCGKTTLARQFTPPESPNYFDLENPVSLARLEQPMTALGNLQGSIVIDEVQRSPDLFPVLRVLADREDLPARFLLLGSASPNLIRNASESLAGRVETIDISGFSLSELPPEYRSDHWLRGGFPLSLLARNDLDSFSWRRNYLRTVVERDVPAFGIRLSATALYRFWAMLAHYQGGIWNGAEFARSLVVSQRAVRDYVDTLTDLFMVRQLAPWHENLKKRQVKSPKVYVRDSGLVHTLLGIQTMEQLLTHPKLGASWEGYIIEETLKALRPDEQYFWATHQGAELDLLLIHRGRRYGIEVKRQDAPRLTPSMRIAMEDLSLDALVVLYPGAQAYPLSEGITAAPVDSLVDLTILNYLPGYELDAG